ncbi:hypothetical protein HYPSUDRAFT_208271 [Hypholoma sublateritium FD-334 SS-4]|uniref:Uncharacterized protein n=1 Tax=Hypholoma sublateritium (strain FD-334 SS-4) TaxID=945553 RepID=A0A0D2LVR7_HYPSF|nr:hypothetical protein HYPSUDRAFT_208271 [Hypholoma sublateritium FD-334 SS-4]
MLNLRKRRSGKEKALSSEPSPINTVDNSPPDDTDVHDSNNVPSNILAFRTITSMLSHIQFNKKFEIQRTTYDALETNDPRRKEIKICSAFAILAVMDAEVIAAVAKPTQRVTEVIESSSAESTSAAKSKGFFGPFTHCFAFGKNPERDDPEPPQKISLNTVKYELCPELKGGTSDEAIKGYTDLYWKRPSLVRHLFILTRLFTMNNESDPNADTNHTTRIFCYVAGTCFPKMLRRFRNKPVSIPYYNALTDIKADDLEFIPSVTQIPIADTGIESERQLLKSFVLPTAGQLGISTPCIIEQAKLAADGKPFQLYTKDTYKEFHKLFVYVLTSFRNSLEFLKANKCTTDGALIPETFKNARLAVALMAFALLKLVESNALRMHLKLIKASLIFGIKKYQHDATPKPDDELDDELDDDELDDELQAVKPYVRKAGIASDLVTNYLDWLKLLATHFDAIQLIIRFVNGTYFKGTIISTKLLAIPPIMITKPVASVTPVHGQAPRQLSQMPWHELFADSGVFPLTGNETNAKIYDFLSETVGAAGAIDWAIKRWGERVPMRSGTRKLLQDVRPNRSEKVVDELITVLTDLKVERLPSPIDRAVTVKLLLDQLELIKKASPWVEPASETAACTEILRLFKELQADILVFRTLAAPQFKGTLHCEACLASFMCPDVQNSKVKPIWQGLAGFRSNIGVSKLCCPVCLKLLTLLNPSAIVKGSHNTITACSLPPWLPAHIVDSMNEYFAAQLKEALDQIMQDPDSGRGRTKSTGSHRLSQDSADGAGGFLPAFTNIQYNAVIDIGRTINIITKK